VEIVTNPESATQLVGGSATFNCAASGTPPLIFMWYKDGESAALVAGGSVSISNQPNESSLTLTNIASSDAGAYYCVASNNLVGGIFTSNSTLANLTVHGKYIVLLDFVLLDFVLLDLTQFIDFFSSLSSYSSCDCS